MTLSFLFCIIFSSLIIFFCFFKRNLFSNTKNLTVAAVAVFAGAFLLRIILAYYGDTFFTDVDLFKYWGKSLNELGLSNVYFSDVYIDYPPGYLYVLLLIEKLRLALGFGYESAAFTFLLKVPSLITDMAMGFIVYKIAEKKADKSLGVFLAAIFLFNPVIYFNSSQWGQIDSVCTFILLASLLLLYKERYIPSAVVFGLAIATKPQMLVFVPIYLFFMIKKREFVKLAVGIVLAAAAILLMAVPFTQSANFMWLIDKYANTMDYYNFYTVNAFNFWGIFQLNWVDLPESAPLKMLITVVGPIFATYLCGRIIFGRKENDSVFIAPVALMTVVYMVTVKMHERYLYTIFVFLLITYIFLRDRRILYAYSAVSLVHFLGVYLVFTFFTYQDGKYIANSGVTMALSIFQMAVCCYLIYVLYSMYIKGKVLPEEEPPDGPKISESGAINELSSELTEQKPPLLQKEKDGRLHKVDYVLIVTITLVYAVVGFWQLGSHDMPATSWLPKEGESVVLEAEDYTDVVTFLTGIAPDNSHYLSRVSSNISIETSNDLKSWEKQENIPGGSVYAYSEFALPNPAKYIRIKALDENVTLNEISFFRYGDSTNQKIKLISGDGGNLIDEQEIVPVYPTYYDETYFDEIYHARTAYEHILELEPFEWTHPTLGKLIISVGIRIFGMNPFGWRFMGALFGVLMLPVLYHLIKQLLGSSFLAAVGTLLFAFDFMHYTQTRIATIDTYAVFFILLMYDCMVFFMRYDIKKTSVRKLCVPLAFSGIFMGLGIASKWSVAYAAAGLAVLFFVKLGVTYMNEKRTQGDTAAMFSKLFRLCCWCCLWFIVLPFGIYFVAFLPISNLPHNSPWSAFINYQKNMFNYHAGLEAEHGFASPWYEWPLNIRPIWYYHNTYVGQYGKLSTISALGNPLLWWSFIPAFFMSVGLLIKEKSRESFVAVAGFAAAYLPWLLISRITFIYHYFTAVPFLIIALMLCFGKLLEVRPFNRQLALGEDTVTQVRLGHILVAIFAAACLVLFVIYLPVISGFITTEAYANKLELLDTWYFA